MENFLLFNVVWMHNISNKFHMDHFPMGTEFNAYIWLCHVSKVVIGKINADKIIFFIVEYPQLQMGQHLTTTWSLLICPTQPQKSSMLGLNGQHS